jgi:hypothetical protein
MIVMALMIAWAGFLLLTVALVVAVASAVGWTWAFCIIDVFYLATAGLLAFLACRELSAIGLAPKRTLRILGEDKVWLTGEARNQLKRQWPQP